MNQMNSLTNDGRYIIKKRKPKKPNKHFNFKDRTGTIMTTRKYGKCIIIEYHDVLHVTIKFINTGCVVRNVRIGNIYSNTMDFLHKSNSLVI